LAPDAREPGSNGGISLEIETAFAGDARIGI
jgi:hypothetical protein